MGFKIMIKAAVIILVVSVSVVILAAYLPRMDRKRVETQLVDKMEQVRQQYQEEVRQITQVNGQNVGGGEGLNQVIQIAKCQKVLEVLRQLWPERFLEHTLRVSPQLLHDKLKEMFHKEYVSLVSNVQMLEKMSSLQLPFSHNNIPILPLASGQPEINVVTRGTEQDGLN